jgi:hypothetical protein
MMSRIFVASISFLILAPLSFAYEVKSVPILPIESYPARAALGSVKIAADPYSTSEKSQTAFDVKDLNDRGYFPLHVIIQNDSKAFLKISTLKILLITASGQQLYTTPAAVVVDDVTKSGLTSKLPSMKSRDQDASKKTGNPLSDFTSKELTGRIVDPETISQGFLFFFTPKPDEKFFSGSTLYIPKLEEEGTGKTLGPFFISLDPALSTKE